MNKLPKYNLAYLLYYILIVLSKEVRFIQIIAGQFEFKVQLIFLLYRPSIELSARDPSTIGLGEDKLEGKSLGSIYKTLNKLLHVARHSIDHQVS
jgi:hypothetical protein